MNRKVLKQKGKKAFFHNWRSCLIVCFLLAVIAGDTLISFRSTVDIDPRENIKNISNMDHKSGEKNSDIVNEFLKDINNKPNYDNKFIKSTEGLIGNIANNVSKSGSFLFGLLNAGNQAFFKDRILPSVIIIIGAIIFFFYWIFVSKVLEVGRARFFLENRKYTKTKARKLFLPYQIEGSKHIAYVMFIKNVRLFLWSLTGIGFFIKSYSYLLVPYILAENPRISAHDAILLSREMMNHHKWEMFLMDLSFIGWQVLGAITFNIFNLVFTNPYKQAVLSEVYMDLRNQAKELNISNTDYLNDRFLEGEAVLDEYPSYEYILKFKKERKYTIFNFNRNYSIVDLILLFFVVAGFGWLWEVLLHLFRYGEFVNRGTLHGPWLPIYGGGAIGVLVLLKKFRKKPLTYFGLTMLVCGIIEYFTSLYLEVVHQMSWWNYDGFFLNINGRICLEGLLFFGIGGALVTYVVAPFVGNILDKIKKEKKLILSVILVVILACDFAYSSKHPNTGEGVTNVVENPVQIKKISSKTS